MNRSIYWEIVLGIIAFGLFCISLPFLIYKGSVNIDIFVRLASLLISWPVAIIVLALVILSRFRASIDFFLRNIRAVNFPGGNVQVQSQPSGTGDAKEEDPGDAIQLTHEQSEELSKFISELQQNLNLASKEKGDLEKQVIHAYRQAYEWKFAYLNSFYVLNTKNVLSWFSRFSPQTKQSFNQCWQQTIPDNDERNVILDVLVQYGMLQSDGISYQITTQGYHFLQYIGYIPYTPIQPTA